MYEFKTILSLKLKFLFDCSFMTKWLQLKLSKTQLIQQRFARCWMRWNVNYLHKI